jgi:hypothetical protein
MFESISYFIIGLALVILGVKNARGNISSLHSYHRKRVKEEDLIPFGKKVGLGNIIIGIGFILSAIVSLINYFIPNATLVWISFGFLAVGLIVGLIIIFGAMIKYNKGIF